MTKCHKQERERPVAELMTKQNEQGRIRAMIPAERGGQ